MEILFAWRSLTPPFVLGGAEVSARILGKCLHNRGYRVSFLGGYLSARDPERMLQSLQQQCKALNVVAAVGPGGALTFNLNGIECRLVPEYTLQDDLTAPIHGRRPDLVVPMFLGEAGTRNLQAQRVPTIAWIHDVSHASWSSLLAPHSAVLFSSEFLRRQCMLLTGRDGRVFYPPFDEPVAAPEQQRTCITLINDIAAKGSWIIRQLAAAFPDQEFMAIQSSRRSELQEDVSPPNLKVMPGCQDLAPVWQQTRVLLVPSLVVEGFGRVAVEAGLHGIPSVAFDRGGLAEAVGEGGILIREDALDPWIEALRSLEDEGRWTELSQKALQHARTFLGDPVDKLIKWGVLPRIQ